MDCKMAFLLYSSGGCNLYLLGGRQACCKVDACATRKRLSAFYVTSDESITEKVTFSWRYAQKSASCDLSN